MEVPDYKPGYSIQYILLLDTEAGKVLGGRNTGNIYPFVRYTPFYPDRNTAKHGQKTG